MWIMTATGWRRIHTSVFNHNADLECFVERSQEEVRAISDASAEQYVQAIRKFLDGGFTGSGDQRRKQMWDTAFAKSGLQIGNLTF